jgi:hypothetical protein
MSPAPDPLHETMTRVGVTLEPAEFAAAVAESFRTAEPVSECVVQERFRRTRGYRDFRAILRKAPLPPSARVLAVGCGRGLAGRSSAYAAEVTREVHPTATIDELNYAAGSATLLERRYDMVVTHSLLHFAFDLGHLCRLLLRAIAPHGCYVMANEPNARFWTNPECAAGLERVSAAEGRRRQLLRFTEPARYLARLLRAVRPDERPDTVAGVNRLLRERLGMHGELTAKEIVRIVDPHVRDEVPGTYRLGSHGLDWDELAAGPLQGLQLETVRTSGYAMRDNPARVPERWRALDDELARRFPLDGFSFTALWRLAS